MSDRDFQKKEVELLVYKGNKFPIFLRLAWLLIIIFSLFYLVRFAWPDLLMWLKKFA